MPDLDHPASWKYGSPVEPGFHVVVSPSNSACRALWFFRLSFYFDMPAPQFGLHLSYLEPGKVETVHVVHSGDCVITPRGYQANVSPPGFANSYFWLSVAHSHADRRFEGVAVTDPNYA